MSAAAPLTDADQDKVAHLVLDEAKRLAIQEGLAEAGAGKFVPHADVKAWLESWGTDTELPPTSCKSPPHLII